MLQAGDPLLVTLVVVEGVVGGCRTLKGGHIRGRTGIVVDVFTSLRTGRWRAE